MLRQAKRRPLAQDIGERAPQEGIVVGVELVGVQKTLSPVLKAKALDNRLPDPILGDAYAEQTMRCLDAVSMSRPRRPIGTRGSATSTRRR